MRPLSFVAPGNADWAGEVITATAALPVISSPANAGIGHQTSGRPLLMSRRWHRHAVIRRQAATLSAILLLRHQWLQQ